MLPEIQLAEWARATERSAIQEQISVASQPGVISFALGLPDPELLPAAAYARAAERVLAAGPQILQYGPPFQPLKAQVVALMAERGVTCREEQVFLTAGAQQGLNLLSRLLLDPGGQVLVEEMTYTGFLQAIEPYRPELLTVPTDPETGIDLDALAWTLASGARPAFIYAIPDGHNPLGHSMSLEKRARLVELALNYRIPVIEDDPYGLLYYGNSPPPPLRALDERLICYVGSFSKIIGPAFRCGWLVVPEELLTRLSVAKEATDLNISTFAQRVISAYLDEGHLAGHLSMLRQEYGARRDCMLRSLREAFPRAARWRVPASGVFIWVELPAGVDTSELLREAVETEQVAFMPGSAFSVGGGRAAHCLRLNFSHCPLDRIAEGVRRLARAIPRLSTEKDNHGEQGAGQGQSMIESPSFPVFP